MHSTLAFKTTYLLVLLFLACSTEAQQNLNITDFGADPAGKNDCSKALYDAWQQACHSSGDSIILIPSGTFLLGPVILKGPCNGGVEFQIKGILTASTDISSSVGIDHWINFQYVDRLILSGQGLLDGQGASAWKYNDCLKNPKCQRLPMTIVFDFVKNAWIHHLTSLNPKNLHFKLFACDNVTVEHMNFTAPGDSPNTDGIDIAMSTNIYIRDSTISTGDDCVAMLPGSENINISNIFCGPGHGISIGSMGGTPNEKHVYLVQIYNCTLTGTQNGLRIKTRAPSYSGNVSNISYAHITMNEVSNPIVIDQQYCPASSCAEVVSQVQIQDVSYNNIVGSSGSKVAVKLQCSPAVPCKNIVLNDINLSYHGGQAASSCSNVQGSAYGQQEPHSCLGN